ncbi:hypothetical protein A2cp1_1318 [Anaeromyxobacter dehalogenans 2CP-1]|uniref:YdhG-like domain-containing protein n=1 Tax=Anaeromyxobacter dehalogenans (strain ATCC BAA-258 / DSM 21875 / 2CP-1) TaxID=455488 RepID=B8JGJ1_ANAD2|nr:hypothetical protein [Anaeromyxobacter dehalogenans]ACL64662.1 hypothetical protein A2cp1_1318 [Anaeromyxobacter dehalogenans 2CP-1]
MATKTMKRIRQTTQSRGTVETKPAGKPAAKEGRPPKTPANEAERTDIQEQVERSRETVLRLIKDAGLKVERKTSWHKVAGKEKRRLYVGVKSPQVHLSGFELKHGGVEPISEADAKRRHLGSVRGILWLDRQTDAIIRDVVRAAVAELR